MFLFLVPREQIIMTFYSCHQLSFVLHKKSWNDALGWENDKLNILRDYYCVTIVQNISKLDVHVLWRVEMNWAASQMVPGGGTSEKTVLSETENVIMLGWSERHLGWTWHHIETSHLSYCQNLINNLVDLWLVSKLSINWKHPDYWLSGWVWLYPDDLVQSSDTGDDTIAVAGDGDGHAWLTHWYSPALWPLWPLGTMIWYHLHPLWQQQLNIKPFY